MHLWKQRLLQWWVPAQKDKENVRCLGSNWAHPTAGPVIVSRCCPCPRYTPPAPTDGELRLHSPLLGDRHLWDGAQWDPESSGQGTARWLPSPPDLGTGITSLPSQHSRPGKHNPSTEAQAPHCTPSLPALPLSTVPTAFPQLSTKPSSLTSPRAPPLLLTPPTPPACVPLPPLCLCLAPRRQTLPS